MLDTFLAIPAAYFTVPAVVGTLYFPVQLAMSGIGAGDVDADFDTGSGVHSHDSSGEIRIISFQTLSAFFMGAGWIGLAVYRLLDTSFGVAALWAIAAGVVTGWMIICISRLVLSLQSSGNIVITDAIDASGEVTVQVPPAGQGRGRVRVVVSGRMREYDAVHADGVPLPGGTRVRASGVEQGGNALVVTRVDAREGGTDDR